MRKRKIVLQGFTGQTQKLVPPHIKVFISIKTGFKKKKSQEPIFSFSHENFITSLLDYLCI